MCKLRFDLIVFTSCTIKKEKFYIWHPLRPCGSYDIILSYSSSKTYKYQFGRVCVCVCVCVCACVLVCVSLYIKELVTYLQFSSGLKPAAKLGTI